MIKAPLGLFLLLNCIANSLESSFKIKWGGCTRNILHYKSTQRLPIQLEPRIIGAKV